MQGIVLNINPFNKSHTVRIDGMIHKISWDQMRHTCSILRVKDTFDVIQTTKNGQSLTKFVLSGETVDYEMLNSNCKSMVVYNGN